MTNRKAKEYLIGHCKVLVGQFLPKDYEGIVFNYTNENSSKDNKKSYDIRRVIVRKQTDWLNELDFWHKNLSKIFHNQSKIWPLLHGSRLVFWKTISPFHFGQTFFVAGLLTYIKNSNEKNVFLINCPKAINIILENLKENHKDLSVECRFMKSNIDFLISELIFIKNLIKNIIFSVNCIRTQKKYLIKSDYSKMIFSYDLSDYSDHFFGNINESVEKKNEKIIWINYYKSGVRVQKENQFYLSDFITLKLILNSTYLLIKERRKILKGIKNIQYLRIDNVYYKNTTKEFIRKLVIEPSSLLDVMAIKIIFNILNMTNIKHIIYPYEDKTIEHSILIAAKMKKQKIKTTAFAHAAYSEGHLYVNKRDLNRLYPDEMALTGSLQYEKFLERGWGQNELRVVGTPRYKELKSNESIRWTIVVLIGYQFELLNSYNWIRQVPEMANDFKIIIRNHPNLDNADGGVLEQKIKNLGVGFTKKNEKLEESLRDADIVLYESTSSALEASLVGKLIIKVRISEFIDSIPFGTAGIVEHCKTPFELYEYLKNLKLLSLKEFKKIKETQRDLISKYYEKFDYEKFIQ